MGQPRSTYYDVPAIPADEAEIAACILQPRRRGRFVATTDSDHNGPIFPSLANPAA